MAFTPSMRAHNKVSEIPLDIRPVMNLMVVLIPILLYSAEFVKLSIRELNLPAASAGPGTGNTTDEVKEEEKRLQLTVLVSKEGFYIGNRGGYLSGEANMTGEPAIPILDNGEYNFQALQDSLVKIQEKVKGQGFIDEKSIIISAERDIMYKHLIRVIDYVTIYTDPQAREEKELFPQINIGQVI